MAAYTDALRKFTDYIGEGKRESELDPKKKKIYKLALRMGYVRAHPIGHGDFIINRTGR